MQVREARGRGEAKRGEVTRGEGRICFTHRPPPPSPPKSPKPNVEEAREVLALPSNKCSFLRCAVPLCGANAKEKDEGAQLDMRATRARDSIF